jgi:ribosomal protein S18 acetylase RimI-like enzyme
MSTLRAMNDAEFKQYIDEAIINYAKERVKAGNWSEEEAILKSREEYNELLPRGVKTQDNYLFCVVDKNEVVGMIWLNKEDDEVGFICEIKILKKYQGMGYGKYAMKEIEVVAKNLGLKKIELHVFGHNKAAINLYEDLEYAVTNMCMSKKLL